VSELQPTEPLLPHHLAVLSAVREAGRTGANPTKLARSAAAELSDDDYEDLEQGWSRRSGGALPHRDHGQGPRGAHRAGDCELTCLHAR